MRQSDRIFLHIVLPTHRIVDELPEQILELEDFGITLKDIYNAIVNLWADYHGLTPMSRQVSAMPNVYAIRELDDLAAVDYVINEDLLEPMVGGHVSVDQYESMKQVIMRAAVAFYLDLDKHLPAVVNLSSNGELSMHRWFHNDAVLRYTT